MAKCQSFLRSVVGTVDSYWNCISVGGCPSASGLIWACDSDTGQVEAGVLIPYVLHQ